MQSLQKVPVLQNQFMNVGIYQLNIAFSLHETEIILCSFPKKNFIIISQKDWNISWSTMLYLIKVYNSYMKHVSVQWICNEIQRKNIKYDWSVISIVRIVLQYICIQKMNINSNQIWLGGILSTIWCYLQFLHLPEGIKKTNCWE